jgi:TolB protein
VAQPEPPAPERAPRQIVDEDSLALKAELAAEVPAAAEPPDGIASVAGKLVYQSFRDGNWEIYYSSDEGADLRRLTTDPAADIEPHLSPDAAQVVFTSKRTGNYELFVVNVDGTGLRQLTNHAAVDGSPAWSPDGKRIAFSSDRDGNPEIYVLRLLANGTWSAPILLEDSPPPFD